MSHCETTIDLFNKSIEEKVCVNLSWTRPNNVPYPHVWKKLEVKSKNGQTYKVKIEDVTADRYEEFLDFMFSNFDCREPVSSSIDISSDPESLAARRVLRRKVLNQKVGLIATLQDDQNNKKFPKIMGTLLLVVNSKNDPPLKITGKKWTLLVNFFINYAKNGVNPFQLLNSDIYFDDFGLAVAPEYYGLGLGFHLFSCILPMSKAFNIPGSLHGYTSNISQSIGEKLGFKLCKEVSYDDYKDENGEKIFPIEGTTRCMIFKIDE